MFMGLKNKINIVTYNIILRTFKQKTLKFLILFLPRIWMGVIPKGSIVYKYAKIIVLFDSLN